MDYFWIGIIIGFVLSIVASIIANLYIDSIRSIIDRTNINLKNSRREKEKSIYLRIKSFKEGRENENTFFLHRAMASILFTSFFITFITTGLLIILFGIMSGIRWDSKIAFWQNINNQKISAIYISSSFMYFLAMISGWIAILRLREFMIYWRRVRNFEKYRSHLESKWGIGWDQ